MCERVVKKIEQKQPLADGDFYHMRVCLPALEKAGKRKIHPASTGKGK